MQVAWTGCQQCLGLHLASKPYHCPLPKPVSDLLAFLSNSLSASLRLISISRSPPHSRQGGLWGGMPVALLQKQTFIRSEAWATRQMVHLWVLEHLGNGIYKLLPYHLAKGCFSELKKYVEQSCASYLTVLNLVLLLCFIKEPCQENKRPFQVMTGRNLFAFLELNALSLILCNS